MCGALRLQTPLSAGFYEGIVNSNVADVAGNTLRQEFRWTFAVVAGSPDDDDDGDGLTNAEELQLGTNPLLADFDGDGYWMPRA